MSLIELVQMQALFYEKEVRSFGKLVQEVRRLDLDSGIRVAGSYARKNCFAFITRSADTYAVMVYERRGEKAPRVGAKIVSREFGSVNELRKLLRKIAPKEVVAYVY